MRVILFGSRSHASMNFGDDPMIFSSQKENPIKNSIITGTGFAATGRGLRAHHAEGGSKETTRASNKDPILTSQHGILLVLRSYLSKKVEWVAVHSVCLDLRLLQAFRRRRPIEPNRNYLLVWCVPRTLTVPWRLMLSWGMPVRHWIW